MILRTRSALSHMAAVLIGLPAAVLAQQPPYDVFPPADPPYYRVRYEASTRPGELIFPVNYTIWIPAGVKELRGVIVHQHGCGEGSCQSGLTGAYDLHWQALAKKHACALLAPTYEQPEKADCQMWCDPRNGSADAFRKCLSDLGTKSGHPELPELRWALWGHSGGGHWAGGMVMLYPNRVAAAWLRSGVPLLKPDPARPTVTAHTLPDAALRVPMMCNLGTKEGVTVKDNQFAGVWPANEEFFNEVRGRGGLIGVSVDPLASHDCGNQRYLAIPWLDACLTARLPKSCIDPLDEMPTDKAWLAVPSGFEAVPAAKFAGDPLKAAWLPDEAIARAWMQYVKDTAVTDTTAPPAPANLRVNGNELSWDAEADLESGLAGFVIERDGGFLANLPEQGKNPFGRPIFQNLQYSDTPTQPLVPLKFTDLTAMPGKKHTYRVFAVNTDGLKSDPSADFPVPIAHWQLDDEGREARDSAGTHYGTIHGAVPYEGKIGKARLFDRSQGDHVSIPYSPDFEIGTFTVSAWVWLTKEPTFSGILGTRTGGEFNFDMKVNADKVHGDIGDGARWIDTKINFYKEDVGSNGQGGDLATQHWYLITFVVDNEHKECRLYLDGDRKKTIPFQGEPRLMRPGQTMTIGNTGAGEFMDGVIDDVRIWKHALSDQQVLGLRGNRSRAQGPAAQPSGTGNWPQKIVVTVGDILTRIDGPKMWTLSGIDFQDTVMATDQSAYGTVLTIRHVGHLGTAHFLDVPGKPGQVEKELVTGLQFFVDDKLVSDLTPMMNLDGQSFRMERKSKIRTLDLATSISLHDGVLIETARFHATGPVDLQSAYPWMYAWTPEATAYVFGDKDGIRQRGKFLAEGKTVSQVVKNATWMAVFDPSSGKGSVCCFLKHPPAAEGSFLLIDAPGVYRKVTAYSLVDTIVPEGFAGTYQSAVGFFNATARDWEEHAQRRAAEIQASNTEG